MLYNKNISQLFLKDKKTTQHSPNHGEKHTFQQFHNLLENCSSQPWHLIILIYINHLDKYPCQLHHNPQFLCFKGCGTQEWVSKKPSLL